MKHLFESRNPTIPPNIHNKQVFTTYFTGKYSAKCEIGLLKLCEKLFEQYLEHEIVYKF